MQDYFYIELYRLVMMYCHRYVTIHSFLLLSGPYRANLKVCVRLLMILWYHRCVYDSWDDVIVSYTFYFQRYKSIICYFFKQYRVSLIIHFWSLFCSTFRAFRLNAFVLGFGHLHIHKYFFTGYWINFIGKKIII